MALGDLGDLIDRLCILNLKIWHLEESIRDAALTDAEVGALTRTLTPINEERSIVKNKINELTTLGSADHKIYGGRVPTANNHQI